MTKIILNSPHQNFEQIKKFDSNGTEFWTARELMSLLEYTDWRNFEIVINKARQSCEKSQQNITSHFVETSKMVTLGSGSQRTIKDYKLSRYACYLIAQNGDPGKQAIANAQTYFAIQTRKQEILSLDESHKRLKTRDQVRQQNKQLFSTVSQAGVTNFGQFNDMGYLGLYGLHIPEIKLKKGLGQDKILDRAGATELAANLFRITQTEEKIKREKITGQGRLSGTHFSVGTKIREAIEKIGGTMPENLPPEPHIKLVAKKLKKLSTNQRNLIK